MKKENKSKSYVLSTLGWRCPRCRTGKLFKNPVSFNFKKTMEMNKECPVCGQQTEIEVGFYYGTSYVSYALTIVVSLLSLLAWWFIIGFSLNDNRFFYWIGCNAVLLIALQPWLMRLSRSLWISWFVSYDPNWKENQPQDFSERLNTQQANNW